MAPYPISSFISFFGQVQAYSTAKSRGWGENIEWLGLEEGQKKASMEQRPLMVIVHKGTCAACQDLKVKFSKASEINQLARSFAMVNLDVEEVPRTDEFAPDGEYVPRIIFFTPEGRLIRSAYNLESPRHRFTYWSDTAVVNVMSKVLSAFR